LRDERRSHTEGRSTKGSGNDPSPHRKLLIGTNAYYAIIQRKPALGERGNSVITAMLFAFQNSPTERRGVLVEKGEGFQQKRGGVQTTQEDKAGLEIDRRSTARCPREQETAASPLDVKRGMGVEKKKEESFEREKESATHLGLKGVAPK